MTDPIADLLNRINNARSAGKDSSDIPFSKVKEEVLRVLKSEGYIADYSSNQEEGVLTATLVDAGKSFKNMIRCSKPGRRVYVKSNRIPYPKSGSGIVVISTSMGVLSGAKARKSGVGGEIICEVW